MADDWKESYQADALNAPRRMVMLAGSEKLPFDVIDGALIVQALTGKAFLKFGNTHQLLVKSHPPPGGKVVVNLWVTPEGRLQVEYEDGA